MKVLLISPKMDRPNGGIAVWTDSYLCGCDKLGIECAVVNTALIGKRAINGSAKRNYFNEIQRTIRIYCELKDATKCKEFDVVHLNTSCGVVGIIRDYLIAKRAKRLCQGAKIVIHYHCDIPFQITNRLAKKFLGKLIYISDVQLVLCENSRQYLKNEFNSNSIKVPNFISEASISQEKKIINDRIKKVFFVGRVDVLKGAREIYELAQRFPTITFQLAGSVSTEVATWNTPPNIELLGTVEHNRVLNYMDEADLFLFPTHSEGFSVALMEAMARGLPAIVTDVGANADMIESHGGVVVPKGNVDAMATAFEILQDPVLRAKMSSWLKQKVTENYTESAVMCQLRAAINE